MKIKPAKKDILVVYFKGKAIHMQQIKIYDVEFNIFQLV